MIWKERQEIIPGALVVLWNLFSCKAHSFVDSDRIASDNLCVFSPSIIDLFGLTCGFHISKYGIKLVESILAVLELASFSRWGYSDTGRNMDESDTGFNFIYILTAISATVKSFKADILILANLWCFWDDADIYIPVFSFMVRTEWTLADPLYGAF